MRNVVLLVLIFSCCFGAESRSICLDVPHPDVHSNIPDDAQAALQSLVDQLPFLKGLAAQLQPKGDVYSCDVTYKNITMTIVAYKPAGKSLFRIALMMKSCSIGTICEGLGDTELDQISLDHPVIIFAADITNSSGERVQVKTDLPKIIQDYVALSADVLYLRKGPNLTSRIESKKSLGEAIGLLKDLGVDLNELVVQSSMGNGKSILLRRKGEWKNPFGLKNSSITDATVRVSKKTGAKGTSNQASITKNLAIWGQAKVGSTNVFLYAERSTKAGKPNGDAYALDAKQVTLQTIVDLANAMPGNPFPTTGLSILPLNKVQIKNPAYVEDPAGDDPSDPSKFLAYINMIIPDGVPTGPKLVAHGEASVLGYSMANIAVDASAKKFYASGDVKNFKLGELDMGPSGAFEITTTDKDPQMSVSGKISAWGLTGQSVKVFIDKSQFKCSTTYGIKNVGDATLTAKTGNNYSLPWSVNVDVSGLAGKIFDAGLDVYNTGMADLKKLGIPVVEPKDVAMAAMHADNLAKESTWIDIGKEAGNLFPSGDTWDKTMHELKPGDALRNPAQTVSTISRAGMKVMYAATDAAKDAGDKAKKFFKNVGRGIKKAWNWLRGKHGGGGSSKPDEPTKPTYDPTVMQWGNYKRKNMAYGAQVSCSSEDPISSGGIMQGSKSFAVDAKENYPEDEGVTYFRSKEERMPWLQVDISWGHKVEAIVLSVPEDVCPDGLSGAVVAVSSTLNDDRIMDPKGGAKFFNITQKGSTVVLLPNAADPVYIAAHDTCHERAKAWVLIPNPNTTWKPSTDLVIEGALNLRKATQEIRYIRVFYPKKARLVISEVKVMELFDGVIDGVKWIGEASREDF